MSVSEWLHVTRPRDDVAVLTMDRQQRANSMAFDLMIPLRERIEALGRDNTVRVVVLTGAGRAFSSGADLEDPGVVPHVDGLTLPTIALRSMRLLVDVITAIRSVPQPVIGAINGPAIGGGLCLALACDLRVASTAAYFRAAGINNGLTATELGISYLLPRVIGAGRAAELMLTGRDLPADEALRTGLVSRCVEPEALLEEALELAGLITRWSRVGVELTKRVLQAGLEASSFASHVDHEGIAQLYVRLTTRNFEEAVAARKEGRTPDFRD